MYRPRITVCLLALIFAAPTIAADKDSNWYVSGNLGNAQSDFLETLESFDLPDTTSLKPPRSIENGFNFEGGYNFGRFFSVELGFRDYSLVEQIDFGCRNPSDLKCFERGLTADSSMSSYSFSLVPRWPVNDNLSLYGKLGVVDWIIESDDFSRLDYNNLQYGLGIRYDFSSEFGIMINYEAVDTERDATSLGLSWRF